MDEQGADTQRLFPEYARGRTVERHRQVLLGFSFVDRRISGGIDDDVGTEIAHRRTDCCWICQIKLAAVTGEKLAERSECRHQFSADLTCLADKQDAHQSKSSASFNGLPCSSLAESSGRPLSGQSIAS